MQRKPNRRAPYNIGGFVTLEQKQRMEALATARNTNITGLLREIADHGVVVVALPQNESSAGDRQVTPSAALSR